MTGLRRPRVHTPRIPYTPTWSCDLCGRTSLPEGTRCPCEYRTVPAPDLRALVARHAELRAARTAELAPPAPPPPPPMCGWCHRRPPVDTAGMCRSCRGGGASQ